MRRDTIFWGSLIILFGILFLIDNAGLLGNLNVWELLLPIFFIFLGLLILINYFINSTTKVKQLKFPVSEVDRAKIQIDHAIGRLYIRSGENEDALIVGSFGDGVEFSQQIAERQANIHLRMPKRWFPFISVLGSRSAMTWSVGIKRDFPLSMFFNTGAGEANLDLSDLMVEKVVLKTGVSSTNIVLPKNAGFTSLRIQAGIASVVVNIPDNVAARIRTDVGLANINIPRTRFPKQGDVYVSDDYDIAENKVEIDISSGISSVSIN